MLYQNDKVHRDNDLPAVIVPKDCFCELAPNNKVKNVLIWYNQGKETSRKECTEELCALYRYNPNRPQMQFVDLDIEVI